MKIKCHEFKVLIISRKTRCWRENFSSEINLEDISASQFSMAPFPVKILIKIILA
jgi:hypothetical protein